MTGEQISAEYGRAVVVFFEKAAMPVYIDALMHDFAQRAHVTAVCDLRACTPLDDEFVQRVLAQDVPRIPAPPEPAQKALL